MRDNGEHIQGQDLFLPLLIVQDVFSDIERTCPTPLKKQSQQKGNTNEHYKKRIG